MDIKKFLTSKPVSHMSVAMLACLLTLSIKGRDASETFADQQDAAVYGNTAQSSERKLNRDYFNPSTFRAVNWSSMSNSEIAALFGETAAKELALDIDSINRGLATPGKLYGLDYNYCNKSVTNALADATQRMKFRANTYAGRPFAKKQGRSAALYNGDRLLEYFGRDSIPGSMIHNPTVADFSRISVGSVIRYPGHTKMYIGIGYVDESGKTFVPDASGRPVIASGYNERFSYYDGGECTVVDIARVVEHNLSKAGRNR